MSKILKHTFDVNGNEIELTNDEAKDLYDQFKLLFERPKEVYVATPISKELLRQAVKEEIKREREDVFRQQAKIHQNPLTARDARDYWSSSSTTTGKLKP